MQKIVPFIIILILFSIGAVSIFAQQANDHIARDGDKLHPGLSLSTNLIHSINDSTRTALIDPEAVTFKESLDAAAYVDGDTISYVQATTKHRFVFRNDTLSYLGFENRATDYCLASAANVAHFPLLDGSAIHDTWSGHILHHGSLLLRRMTGISSSRVEKGWALTYGTDTIPDVTRLTWTLAMAYADMDSVNASLPDSLASDIISDLRIDVKEALSERLLTERSLWFSESARYPILTDTRVSRIIMTEQADPDTVPLSLLAMYYPPSLQYSDTGEEPYAKHGLRKSSGQGNDSPYSEGNPENPLNISEPSVSRNAISIQLSSEVSIAATVALYTDSGIRLTEPVTITVGRIPQTYTISIPSGYQGVMLLHVDAGENSYARKVII